MTNFQELKSAILTPPSDFALFSDTPHYDRFFKPNGWGFSGITIHRDGYLLDKSNWELITSDIRSRFPDTSMIVHCSHSLCGWMDHLAIDTSDETLLKCIQDYHEALSIYPCIDEEHYSQLQMDLYVECYRPKYDPETGLWSHDLSEETFTTEEQADQDSYDCFFNCEVSA